MNQEMMEDRELLGARGSNRDTKDHEVQMDEAAPQQGD